MLCLYFLVIFVSELQKICSKKVLQRNLLYIYDFLYRYMAVVNIVIELIKYLFGSITVVIV